MDSKIIRFPRKGGDRRHPIEIRLEELGKSKHWLCLELGIGRGTLDSWISGKVLLPPRAIRTIRLCQVLGIGLNYLYLGPECVEANRMRKRER